MAKIMVQYGRPSFSSRTESVRSSFGRSITGKAMWEKLVETCWEKIPNWECLSLCSSWIRIVLICVFAWHKNWLERNIILIRCGNYSTRSWFGRTNIFLRSCTLGLHSTKMRNKQRYCGQLQNHVWIANFSGRSREITIPSKSSYFFMVLWYGGSCKEMCRPILWVSKQDNATTLQSFSSMHRWPPLQRRRNEICWKIVTNMLPNCSEMFLFGKLDDLDSMVSKQARTICYTMDQGLWQTPESIVPISWMCKKQTAVSHFSTEFEIISSDTGLRLDGLPILELWDPIVSVLGNISRISDRSEKPESDVHKRRKSQKMWWKTLTLFFQMSRAWSFIVCVWGQWSCNQDDY